MGTSTAKVNSLAAEVRAVEAGLQARQLPDGTFLVRCMGTCGGKGSHRLRAGSEGLEAGSRLHVTCDCTSGRVRTREPIPCLHAAVVARRLERTGWAEWSDGAWWLTMDVS